MTALLRELEEAEARAAALRLRVAHATCAEAGCRMKSIGGTNCGCPEGHCSVPLHECTVCGDCDYGENEEADKIRERCAEERS